MNARRHVLDALEDAPQGLCDACLLKELPLSSHQHVNATCRLLEKEGRLTREKNLNEECQGCLRVRVINRLVPAAKAVKAVTSSPITPQSVTATFDINELDALRRDVIQYLNKLSPTISKDGFSKRVTTLRNDQLISPTIASLLLTHAAYRNEMYYNKYQLSDYEREILRRIDQHIRITLAL